MRRGDDLRFLHGMSVIADSLSLFCTGTKMAILLPSVRFGSEPPYPSSNRAHLVHGQSATTAETKVGCGAEGPGTGSAPSVKSFDKHADGCSNYSSLGQLCDGAQRTDVADNGIHHAQRNALPFSGELWFGLVRGEQGRVQKALPSLHP